ncbi:hypothetical protein DAEQUDRAFT_755847 [Daedalea quercina L-15889]|uniref:CCHC-type domain-containing protein n=1 Tax=Daedalea quercina L-15889 TaxID=1314783 RepID=A0A165RZG3_9APHY|nr:hypothetical protein DAEQUDRAFT_755847 [Daedalea quercina L-15889]
MAGARGCFNCGGCGTLNLIRNKSGIRRRTARKQAPQHGGGEGHVSRDCTGETKAKTCYKCGKEGHLSRDCPDNMAPAASGGSTECYRCGQVGHIARACPQANTNGAPGYAAFPASNKTCRCYNCSEVGHMSKDCPQPQKRACYTCGSEGHISRDCPTIAPAETEGAA